MIPMILFNQVNKWYGDYHALTDLSAEVKAGRVVVVCGPSGSGKSTLIRTVNRLEPIEQGQILFDGIDIHGSSMRLNQLRTRIGFVFQNFNLFPHVSVMENIMMSPVKVLGTKRSEARKHAGNCWSEWDCRIKLMPIRPSSLAGNSSASLSPVRWR
jgi:polar amino acid transport system ATP-binding protein